MKHETKLWGFLCSKTQGDVFKMNICPGLHTCCHRQSPAPTSFRSVQSLSRVWLFATPWTAARPSPTPRASSNSCPSSRWCHPTISSSVVPFSSCLQSFLASGSFPMSQVCASSDQSIGASASESVIPMNKQDWFPLGLLAVQGTLKRLLQCRSSKFVFSFSTVGSQQETDLCSVISVLSFYLIWKRSWIVNEFSSFNST